MGYFRDKANEESRADSGSRGARAELRFGVACATFVTRPAIPARTPAVAPLPACHRFPCRRHRRSSRANATGIQSPGGSSRDGTKIKNGVGRIRRTTPSTLAVGGSWFLRDVFRKNPSPPANARGESKIFLMENNAFIGNRATAEVYNSPNFLQSAAIRERGHGGARSKAKDGIPFKRIGTRRFASAFCSDALENQGESSASQSPSFYNNRSEARKVSPQNTTLDTAKDTQMRDEGSISRRLRRSRVRSTRRG